MNALRNSIQVKLRVDFKTSHTKNTTYITKNITEINQFLSIAYYLKLFGKYIYIFSNTCEMKNITKMNSYL